MGTGILDAGLDEGAGGTLTQRASGEVCRQLEIEAIYAVAVGFAGGRRRFEDGDVHAGGFDCDVGVVDGLAEEVIGPDGARDVVSWAVVAFGLVVLFGKLDGYLELGQDVALNVQCDFSGVRW